MRCVAAPARAGLAPLPAPDRAALDAVRYLGARFPRARLREVPLVRASELDARADPDGRTRVWLALEALQVTGSFRVRGALVSLDSKRSRGQVVAASIGNHGVAVAYAANVLGMSATVCVPRTAPQAKRTKIQKYGGRLVVAEGDRYEDAERLAKEIAAKQGCAFISPYDDVDVATGNGGSLGFEIVRALGAVPQHVLAPLGGGGLTTGLAWALSEESRGKVQPVIWGVGGEASCALADGLADYAAAERIARAIGSVAGIVVVTDAQIGAARAHAYSDMGLVVEGCAAAALAPALFGLPEAVRGGELVVVLTGRNVGQEQIEAVLRRAEETPRTW